jgi:ATP-dependent DNA helicase RecG
MNPALIKLAKYLRLEADRGFDNHAVVGGLQQMLDPWQIEAHETKLPKAMVDTVINSLKDYSHLSPQARQEALRDLWNKLGTEYPQFRTHEAAPKSELVESQPEDTNKNVTSTEEMAVKIHSGDEHAREKPEDRAVSPMPIPPPQYETIPEQEKSKPVEPVEPPAALEAPLTAIDGIGPKSAKTLHKLDLETLEDLLWHLPRRYDDYSQLKTINRLMYGEEVTVIGTVEDISVRAVKNGRMQLVEAVISDGTGALRATWFNQPWIADQLRPGRPIVISGKVDQYLGRLTMNGPEWEALERKQLHTNRIVPVYPLTSGVTAKWLRRVIHSVVTRLAPRVPDHLPQSVLDSADLLPLSTALQQVHFPDNWENLHRAQHRLAFDEMFLLQLGVLHQKSAWEQLSCPPLNVENPWVAQFQDALPYELTKSQQDALKDIRDDLASARPMNRLLQGDVGSGKTVIAAFAVGITAANQAQTAIMAPTSILADQHYHTLLDLLPSAADIPADAIRLLIGATPEAEKQEIREKLADGKIQVVVGTHALIEEPVNFRNLGLTIIDEQHRFGVEQRAKLRAKGDNPNLLVMTATPIPRSLALTIYGDLDQTLIDEMPPGRIPIETSVLRPVERMRAHNFVIGQLEHGHQAFIIYPLVEGSEKVQAKAAVDEHQRLQDDTFVGYKVGLLHGRMRQDEKENVMSQFRTGEYHVLVSTSVVEVGLDIPNATVILIEGANRFGLAQLHQFRGRVGRGKIKSYCLLIPDSENEADNQRLSAMKSTNDGFELADLDLKQRGPGDFLGTRQSGFAELRTARLTDVRLIEKARQQAKRLFASDPELNQPKYALLSEKMASFWTTGKGEIS